MCERTLEVAGQALSHVLVEVLDAFGHFVRLQLLRGGEAERLVWVGWGGSVDLGRGRLPSYWTRS